MMFENWKFSWVTSVKWDKVKQEKNEIKLQWDQVQYRYHSLSIAAILIGKWHFSTILVCIAVILKAKFVKYYMQNYPKFLNSKFIKRQNNSH